MAAVTNYYKHDALKQYKFIILESCRAEVQNQSYWAKIKVSAFLSGGARGE